jgi:alkylation response protein AidB-like acyl-CoA dehydrogenase
MARVRALMTHDDNVDSAVWRECAELGWFALGLPERLGGSGGVLADEVLVLREVGRALAPGPFVATVLGARVAAFAGQDQLAGEIASGATRVALALPDGATASTSGLSGALWLVDASDADYALATTPDLGMLVAVTDLRDTVAEPCIDDGTRLATARADAVPAVALVTAATDPVYRRGLVLSAAMQVGIAEGSRDLAVEHAKSRVQFDRPIGSNQAVKHPCADMALRCEAGWAQTIVAALSRDEGRADADVQSDIAWIVATDAAERNAAAALQIHGGMGFTFESDVNLYLKRSHVLGHGLTDRMTVLDRIAHSSDGAALRSR